MESAPILLTPRLTLRLHRKSDFERCAAIWGDPATTRFIGGVPQSRQASWNRLLRYGGMWPMLGYGFWALEERATGAYLGEAGFMDAQRGIAGLDGLPEAGWVLAPEASGRGIASEALATIFAWADEKLPERRTACIIDEGNAPSHRVAAKMGFREAGRPLLEEKPVILLYRDRP